MIFELVFFIKYLFIFINHLFLQSLNVSLPRGIRPLAMTIFLHLPAVLVTSFLSLRWSETIFSRSLNVSLPRGIRPLAMTIFLHLPAVLVTSFLSLRWSVVTEAISLQATLVFGLLRYARNDKSQDRHVVLKDSSR